MTEIYFGTGWLNKTQVGQCNNGEIYLGYGWGRTQIGCYRDGEIYSGYGWGKTQIGSYDGADDGAAAAALLLLLNKS